MIRINKYIRFVRQNIGACAILAILLPVNIINVFKKPPTISITLYNPQISNEISCHVLDSEDGLRIADDEYFPEKSIFFHETSCKGGLNSRQACAVESAARSNPEWHVNILFSGPLDKPHLEDGTLGILRNLGNVNMARIHVSKYAEGTLAEKFLKDDKSLEKSKYRINNEANLLRLVTLYKHGGIYLDMDVITVKSFDALPKNWMAWESNETVGSAILAIAKDELGRNFTETAMSKFQENFMPNEWGHNGPFLIKEVIQTLCMTGNITMMSAKTCKGFEVFNNTFFYPIPYIHNELYFKSYEDVETQKSLMMLDVQLTEAYTHHIWNRLSHKSKIQKDSIFDRIAGKFCPSIYEIYGDNFGL